MSMIEPLHVHALRSLQRIHGGEIVGNKLMPILHSLVRQRPKPEARSGVPWLVIRTIPRAETSTADWLERSDVIYYPRTREPQHHGRGQMRHVITPLFRTYLFAQRDELPVEDQAFRIKATPGVNGVLRPSLADHYSVVPDRFVRKLKAREVDGVIKLPRPEVEHTIQEGDRVRVIDGPFTGLNAVIEQILRLDHHGRVLLLKAAVRIFGRATPVQFAPDQLERLRGPKKSGDRYGVSMAA